MTEVALNTCAAFENAYSLDLGKEVSLITFPPAHILHSFHKESEMIRYEITIKFYETHQISIARVYSLKVSMTSGARYHRVATYSVIKVFASCDESAERNDDLASPKSQS